MDERTDLEGRDPFFEGEQIGVESDVPRFVADEPYRTADFGTAGGPAMGEQYGTPSMEIEDKELEAQRSQVEQTRAEMTETIDAIQEKLSPQHLAQQAKDTVKDATIGRAQDMVNNVENTAVQAASSAADTATGVGSTVTETIRQNPIPAALAGIGLGWLIMSARKQGSSRQQGLPYEKRYAYSNIGYDTYGSGQQSGESGSSVGQALNQAQNTAGQVAGQAQDTAGQVAGQFQSTAGQVAGQVQDTAGQVVNQVQSQARQAESGIERMMRQNPLAAGVASLALGAVVGFAIPETTTEDRLMGSARESFTQEAQQALQGTAQKVESVAKEAIDAGKNAAQQKAQDQGLTQSK